MTLFAVSNSVQPIASFAASSNPRFNGVSPKSFTSLSSTGSPFTSNSFSRSLRIPCTPKQKSRFQICATSTQVKSPDTSESNSGSKKSDIPREADVVVIGSGIGGLCCAALLARYGRKVAVLESHYIAGGAAHSFTKNGFHFDSGPSLFSGLTSRGLQANPLAQVLEAVGEKVTCAKYDSWMCYLPEGDFLSRIGPTHFYEVLEKYAGPGGVEDWRKLLNAVEPLTGAAMAIPPASLRADPAVVLTSLFRYLPSIASSFLKGGISGAANSRFLLGPFSNLVDSAGIENKFVRNWVDLLSFLLSGLKSDGTLAAEIIYMFGEWYKPNSVLEYPIGGTSAIVDALVRGIKKYGGDVFLNSHVDQIIVENGRATGVKLKGDRIIRAKQAVVSNASIWNTLRMLPDNSLPKHYESNAKKTPQCESFMHLHLGIDAKDLPKDLEIHHIVVDNWESGVDSAQNVVLISIPSVLDPSLAPPGKHSLHAYTPGTEPCELWQGLKRGSKEYIELKEKRSEVLWRAVERVLGDSFKRENCDVAMVGTPLTHEFFLRRDRGTYGPAIRAGKETFASPISPIPGLLYCGDSTFPGIGIPAVAASGLVAANSLVPLSDHVKLLDAVGI